MACHLRSTSLPSRPHSSETEVEEELQSLNTSISSSSATVKTICDSLRRLGDVYSCIEEIICLPSNQVGLCQPQQKKMVEEELERSVELLDLCNAMQESFTELKMSIQEVLLVLKRGDDTALQVKIQTYVRLARKAKIHFRKIRKKTTSNMVDCRLVELLIKTREITAALLESTLRLLAKQIVMPNTGKWSIVSKTFQKRKVVCEEERLQALECSIGHLESGAELLFRRLIQITVSILNTLSS